MSGTRSALTARAVGWCLLLAAGAAALLAATPPGPALATAARDPGTWVTERGVDAALVDLVALLAWLCLLWLVAGAAVTALGHVPGTVGRAAAVVARAVTPALVRRAVEGLFGATALVGVVAPGAAATAATPGHGPPLAAAAAPSVDWPAPLAPAAAPGADWPIWSRVPEAATEPPPGSDLSVVVRRGDTLWDIAARHLGPGAGPAAVAVAWPAWHEANRDVIGPDPDRLFPGQRLVPPH